MFEAFASSPSALLPPSLGSPPAKQSLHSPYSSTSFVRSFITRPPRPSHPDKTREIVTTLHCCMAVLMRHEPRRDETSQK
mmetsp:Transcript_40911/g.80642  ORF Transcript_40911/g.80642 Transcript_40911/m.80642 type:complete len:80 (-) Transcript_40911:755-994(-)